jgi:hypothetical protein
LGNHKVLESERPNRPYRQNLSTPSVFSHVAFGQNATATLWEQPRQVIESSHPFFTVTDPDGRFELPGGLPPGRYVLEARHRKLGALMREFTLKSGEQKTLDFIFNAPF